MNRLLITSIKVEKVKDANHDYMIITKPRDCTIPDDFSAPVAPCIEYFTETIKPYNFILENGKRVQIGLSSDVKEHLRPFMESYDNLIKRNEHLEKFSMGLQLTLRTLSSKMDDIKSMRFIDRLKFLFSGKVE